MFTYKQIIRYLALLTLLLICNVSLAQAGALALFTDSANPQSVIAKKAPVFVSRSRYVSVDTFSLLDATAAAKDAAALPEIAFNLFTNANFIGVVTEVQKTSGTTAWIGTLKGTPQGYFYLVLTDGVFIAHIGSPLGIYEVSSAGGNLYKVIQIDQSKLGEDAPGIMATPGPVLNQAVLGPTADTGDVIDVMVVYTTAARTGEGSTAAMNARIALAVTETNQAYANSGVTPRLRLVHTEEVSYTESGDIGLDVDRLANKTDGYMDNVHPLRNTYGADMVSLIVENGGGYCGMAKAIMATAATAFDVTARDGCMTGYYSFGHEFGHLQGARHDTYVDPTNTPYAYGHGRTHPSATTEQSWRTVMAYNNACTALGYNCTRLQYFSNPTKLYLGASLGINGVAEVYKVLNNTRSTVGNFRTAVIGADFNAQFNVSSAGWTPVSGSWAVASGSYRTPGLSGKSSSSSHSGIYGDITYEAKMNRTGCTTCANRLIIRGNPAVIDTTKRWLPSYTFQYINDGSASVFKISPTGTVTALMGWTTSAAIIPNDWNTLKVVAVGSSFSFYINGTLVWTGTDADYPTGKVGVGMYNDTISTGNKLYVDWATLQTTPTAADVNNNIAATIGTPVAGGNIDQAPSAATDN